MLLNSVCNETCKCHAIKKIGFHLGMLVWTLGFMNNGPQDIKYKVLK